MTDKKYLYIFLLFTLSFVLFHFLTWNLNAKIFFDVEDGYKVGDLGRLSYSKEAIIQRRTEYNLPFRHKNYDKKDAYIVTIGDSFSNGDSGGLNPYYQDYIATTKSVTVLNIQKSGMGYIETILMLNKSGFLDKLNTKNIILQISERHAVSELSRSINWNVNPKEGQVENILESKYNKEKLKLAFINNMNYNSILYPMLYKFDDNAFFSKVYKVNLRQQFFNNKSKKLLFFSDDLENVKNSTIVSVSLLNANLNKLQEILKNSKVNLHFMPAVDKFNLYYKYIENNIYNESVFFELLREMPREYTLVDTKKILRDLTDLGVKDVFYADDTHWSNIASKEIVKNIEF